MQNIKTISNNDKLRQFSINVENVFVLELIPIVMMNKMNESANS